ncbi:M23 family metallopeptidase [Streptomyces sp. RS10V-4]|uniref:M23 family metallopeptidase n=1 Tax=Streptomyces rhizoryzae TaxID=2932493 RepID=UPI0020060245|nr:M23 family metallopeptidase [Streptomyces rhizoryzae]MCK7625426.1 M23 family metallopeptidase [Streptomyces rhizoryzae]
MLVFLAMVVGSHFAAIPYWLTWVPFALSVAVTALANGRRGTGAGGAPGARPLAVAPPVTGRWKALNSPADRIPSHGTRAYGQTYAIDLVAEPEPGARPAFGWWPVARRSEDFPAFGMPLTAVADATVVRADDRQRDHLSRTSWLALGYLFLAEGLVRTLGGARRMIGNHVVLDLGGGTYALYAHVRRGSLAVRPGDRVRAGQVLGACGNSGNSTEPHVHFQLMTTGDPNTADGLPFTWHGIGVPRNGEVFEAGPAHAAPPHTGPAHAAPAGPGDPRPDVSGAA